MPTSSLQPLRSTRSWLFPAIIIIIIIVIPIRRARSRPWSNTQQRLRTLWIIPRLHIHPRRPIVIFTPTFSFAFPWSYICSPLTLPGIVPSFTITFPIPFPLSIRCVPVAIPAKIAIKIKKMTNVKCFSTLPRRRCLRWSTIPAVDTSPRRVIPVWRSAMIRRVRTWARSAMLQ